MYAPADWLERHGFDPESPVEGGGFIARAYPCARHLREAQSWFYDPETFTVEEHDQMEALGLYTETLPGEKVLDFAVAQRKLA